MADAGGGERAKGDCCVLIDGSRLANAFAIGRRQALMEDEKVDWGIRIFPNMKLQQAENRDMKTGKCGLVATKSDVHWYVWNRGQAGVDNNRPSCWYASLLVELYLV